MSGDEHGKHLKPATHVIHGAYNPRWAEGAAKCPIFETSTWVFPTAEEGERFFSIVSGASQLHEGEFVPLAYSRINHPGLEIAENRLVVWDGAEDCAVFASGTAAISGTLLEFLEHGDVLLHNETLRRHADDDTEVFAADANITPSVFFEGNVRRNSEESRPVYAATFVETYRMHLYRDSDESAQ